MSDERAAVAREYFIGSIAYAQPPAPTRPQPHAQPHARPHAKALLCSGPARELSRRLSCITHAQLRAGGRRRHRVRRAGRRGLVPGHLLHHLLYMPLALHPLATTPEGM